MIRYIGDPVIHLIYGHGRIIGIDERNIEGQTRKYNVVDKDNHHLGINRREGRMKFF